MLRSKEDTSKYHPMAAVNVSLYALHRDFDFIDYQEFVLDPINLHYYRFQRADGVFINYFEAISDALSEKETNNVYPLLAQFLLAYKGLEESSAISAQDITIVPFLQVQNRQHFNTLVLYADNSQRYVHIIEPRSNNLTRPPAVFYPIDESIQRIKAFFGQENVVVHNPKIGLQGIRDDTTCGAHHINFTEIIAHLKTETITRVNALKRVLRRTNLSRRDVDQDKIKVISGQLSAMEDQSKTDQPEIARVQVLSARDDEEKEESDDELFEGFMSEAGEDLERDASSYQAMDPVHSASVQKDLANEIKKIELERADTALEKVIGIFEAYTQQLSQPWGFFTPAGRPSTVIKLIEILKNIKNNPYADSRIKNYHAALLLNFFHNAISSTDKQFCDVIENSLATLLNCELEYKAISQHKNGNHYKQAGALFRLHLCAAGVMSPDEMKMHRQVKKIVELDKSWAYKLDLQTNKIDYTRNGLFTFLNDLIQEHMGNRPQFRYVL